MIKQIIKALKANTEIYAWEVSEEVTSSTEQFYVKGNLETTRKTAIDEAKVNVFVKQNINGKDVIGSSSFNVGHKLTKKEIADEIAEAIYAAKFVKNPAYELPAGPLKKKFKSAALAEDPFEVLTKCANLFFSVTKDNVRFNSLELFYTTKEIHFINSNGRDLKKHLFELMIESIPSFDGVEKVELYCMFNYTDINYDQILADAKQAIANVTYRSAAKKLEGISKTDVILKDHDTMEFFRDIISNMSYAAIVKHQNTLNLGDNLQDNVKGDKVTIGVAPSEKANGFDKDGVIIKTANVVEDGKFVAAYGDNQYASYLGVEATGNPGKITVKKGKTSIDVMRKKPYLEILALSGIQIDIFAGYIGGEIRLALYFDGKELHPVSGISFSGNIKNALDTVKLSKEVTNIKGYSGPKYIKFANMDVL